MWLALGVKPGMLFRILEQCTHILRTHIRRCSKDSSPKVIITRNHSSRRKWSSQSRANETSENRGPVDPSLCSPASCGLPQGSPVSPILFLLHTEPIYHLGKPQGRFGYAEDTAILSIGDFADENSSSIDEMVRWGVANGVSFDPKKTEVMYVSCSKVRAWPAIRHGDVETFEQ
ncbi:hypothetical protein FANTH_9780 [Fusarium anthophilum]|uniref:Reverse transcriptase domain-containing protein n=1 Tax=Fusarium anthophilum TaxID=48485 RepID=A0A8H5DY35_9HYPO|nr:hypothetical protein FANTH_9780 [Fusarium anthophilum]